jgi:hypothetical protein
VYANPTKQLIDGYVELRHQDGVRYLHATGNDRSTTANPYRTGELSEVKQNDNMTTSTQRCILPLRQARRAQVSGRTKGISRVPAGEAK